MRSAIPQVFRDRVDAGRVLASMLSHYATAEYHGRLLVLGLPRGGVPVALEVARALQAPLDIVLVRKLGVPGHPELAMGAIATGGYRVINEEVVRTLQISWPELERVEREEQQELTRREAVYRGTRPPPTIADRVVILVDDGLATGSSMRVALQAVRHHEPARTVVAVPVAPPEVCDVIRAEVDELVCALAPSSFLAVGAWYADFREVTDDDVRRLLDQAAERPIPKG